MRRLSAVLVALGLVVTAGAALAATNGDVLNACVKNNNGQLRLVDGPDDCNGSEYFVSWNQQGPEGPAGEDGGGLIETVAATTFTWDATGCPEDTFRVVVADDYLIDLPWQTISECGGFVDQGGNYFINGQIGLRIADAPAIADSWTQFSQGTIGDWTLMEDGYWRTNCVQIGGPTDPLEGSDWYFDYDIVVDCAVFVTDANGGPERGAEVLSSLVSSPIIWERISD